MTTQAARTSTGIWTLVILATVLVPVVITFSGIREPRPFVPVEGDPSPYGYTRALLIYFIPDFVLVYWLARNKRIAAHQHGLVISLVLLTAVGYVLDILFAKLFFTFENRARCSASKRRWSAARCP